MFDLEKLPKIRFARAERVAAIGAPLIWKLRGQDTVLVANAIAKIGTDLGRLRHLGTAPATLSDSSLHLLQLKQGRDGAELVMAETWEDAKRLRPQSVVHNRPDTLGEWLDRKYKSFLHHPRVGAALAKAGAARGALSCLIQSGLSDLDFLVWITNEITRLSGTTLVLIGRPGSAWELVPISSKVPAIHTPMSSTLGYTQAPIGPLAKVTPGRGGCWLTRHAGPLDTKLWEAERTRDLIPFVVPHHIGPRVALARRDRFLQGGAGHVRDFYLADNPDDFGPVAALVSSPLLRAVTGQYDPKNWTVPCRLTGFKPGADVVPALLSTPWAGVSGKLGWHGVHDINQPVLVWNPQSLDGVPHLLLASRPDGVGGDGEDIRSMGSSVMWVGQQDTFRIRGNFEAAGGKQATMAADGVEIRTASRTIACDSKIEFR